MKPKKINQKTTFLDDEGNAWFERNKSKLEERNDFHFLNDFLPYLNEKSIVLEIGCANGINLAYLNSKTGCSCFGIDPAKSAIEKATPHPKIKLSVGTADDFELQQEFDFILFGFCLYLCDRSLLPKIIYNADQHLKDSGYLGIIDFDPAYPAKKPYQHTNAVMSYKMDYSKPFLGFPAYSLVSKRSYSHAGAVFTNDEDERVASWLLYKNSDLGFVSL